MVNKVYSSLDSYVPHYYQYTPAQWIYTSLTFSLSDLPINTLHSFLLPLHHSHHHCHQPPWFHGHHRCLLLHPLWQVHLPPSTSSPESEPLDLEEVECTLARSHWISSATHAYTATTLLPRQSRMMEKSHKFFVLCSGTWMWYIKLPFLHCVSVVGLEIVVTKLRSIEYIFPSFWDNLTVTKSNVQQYDERENLIFAHSL
ncbi:hypothetical protein AAZV13_12G074300 [Glycine max]